MIVVDTSALIAMVKEEETAGLCAEILDREDKIIISAATLAEARIVALRANRLSELDEILKTSIAEVVPLTAGRAIFASNVYSGWGKGFNPAALNYGDCFAYATAKEFDCPLLFVGEDFARTDVKPAIPAAAS